MSTIRTIVLRGKRSSSSAQLRRTNSHACVPWRRFAMQACSRNGAWRTQEDTRRASVAVRQVRASSALPRPIQSPISARAWTRYNSRSPASRSLSQAKPCSSAVQASSGTM